MSIDKLKNKFFTGAWLPDSKHYFKKINEIIDYLNGIGTSGDGSCKVYAALLSQSGTSAPTVESNGNGINTPLKNSFTSTTFTYSYILPGQYKLTSSLPIFTEKKTFISMNGDDVAFYFALRSSTTEILIFTADQSAVKQNDYLNLTNFKIEVYN